MTKIRPSLRTLCAWRKPLRVSCSLIAGRGNFWQRWIYLLLLGIVVDDGVVCVYYPVGARLRASEAGSGGVGPRLAVLGSGLPIELVDAYGHRLLMSRHPVLSSFLEREQRQCEAILQELSRGNEAAERTAERRKELCAKLERNRAAAAYIK